MNRPRSYPDLYTKGYRNGRHDTEVKLAARIETLETALRGLFDLCQTLGSFKNGIEHQGIDEGEVYASGVFDRVVAALAPEQDK